MRQAPSKTAPVEQSYVGEDGTVHVRELTIPLSELLTPQYRALLVRAATQGSAEPAKFPVPARTASKVDWDRFDAWWDCRYNSELLSQARERYAVTVTEGKIAGVNAATICPADGVAPGNQGRILINLHGGGFVYHRGLRFGQLESIPIAALGRIRIVTLDYRQAPFHCYPAASEDVAAVYQALLNQYAATSIGIFGCSAGGSLTAQAVSWFQSAALPTPGAIGIFNMAPMPFCDRPPWGRGWGESGMWFSGMVPKTEMSDADRALWEPVRWYMESADASDPKAYPGASDEVLAKFPPTLFLTGTRDFAMSASVFMHARFLKLGIDSALYVIEGGGHTTHVIAVGTDEAHDAQAYVARWFAERLG